MSRMKLSSIKSLAAAALLFAFVAPVARAAPTTSDEACSYDQLARMKAMEVMHMIDSDKKGFVTREEFLKFQEQFFDRMDQNHDGKVDPREWMGKAGTGAASK